MAFGVIPLGLNEHMSTHFSFLVFGGNNFKTKAGKKTYMFSTKVNDIRESQIDILDKKMYYGDYFTNNHYF